MPSFAPGLDGGKSFGSATRTPAAVRFTAQPSSKFRYSKPMSFRPFATIASAVSLRISALMFAWK
jgi:hypothetical protein